MKQWWQNSTALQHEHISSSRNRSALSREFCSLDWGYHRMKSLKNLGALKAAVMCVCTYVSKPRVYTPLWATSKRNYSMQQHRLGANWLKSSFTEEELRAPVDKVSTSQQCLPFQQRPAASWVILARMQPAGRGNGFLPSSQYLWDHIWSTVPKFGLHSNRQVSRVEQDWQKATEVVKVLENMTCEESLREQGLFIPKGREGGNTIAFNYQTRSL